MSSVVNVNVRSHPRGADSNRPGQVAAADSGSASMAGGIAPSQLTAFSGLASGADTRGNVHAENLWNDNVNMIDDQPQPMDVDSVDYADAPSWLVNDADTLFTW
nr:uncharacterized protein CI109_001878 [Kwoniella shandongensis]KAA5529938.1 hypothetical protein CI109_001878 [Kwoniella shandongensis]